MSRLGLSLVVLLILGLSFVVADSEEDSDEEKLDNQKSTSSEESDEVTVVLTKSNCLNGLQTAELMRLCCHRHLSFDNAFEYCRQHLDLSDFDSSTEKGKIQGFMKVVECFYRKKKYIKSKNVVNMKQVEADAAKLHDSAKAEFLIEMYKTCERQGQYSLQMYNEHAQDKDKELFSAHQFFAYHIFYCVDNYFTERVCPYFHWSSASDDDNDKCLELAKQCKKLVV